MESEDRFANFNFRGFKGEYEIKLMDGENELKTWHKNTDDDDDYERSATQWILSLVD